LLWHASVYPGRSRFWMDWRDRSVARWSYDLSPGGRDMDRRQTPVGKARSESACFSPEQRWKRLTRRCSQRLRHALFFWCQTWPVCFHELPLAFLWAVAYLCLVRCWYHHYDQRTNRIPILQSVAALFCRSYWLLVAYFAGHRQFRSRIHRCRWRIHCAGETTHSDHQLCHQHPSFLRHVPRRRRQVSDTEDHLGRLSAANHPTRRCSRRLSSLFPPFS